MLRLILPAALAAAAVTTVAPASATAAEGVRVQTVSYGDLDLTRVNGVQTLERRVRFAVAGVCSHSRSITLAERTGYWACVETAKADAKVQVERAVRVAHLARSLTTAQR